MKGLTCRKPGCARPASVELTRGKGNRQAHGGWFMGQQSPRPHWLDEVIRALERQLDARRRVDPRANRSGGFWRVGEAVRDAAAAPGWYRIDLRRRQLDADG